LVKQLVFGVHLPVMGFNKNSDNWNRVMEKEKYHSREQMELQRKRW
jgi:hypothetical protein